MERCCGRGRQDPTKSKEVNKLGFPKQPLRIYQDVYPADAPKWKWLPKEGGRRSGRLPNGDWMRGWEHHERNKGRYETISPAA